MKKLIAFILCTVLAIVLIVLMIVSFKFIKNRSIFTADVSEYLNNNYIEDFTIDRTELSIDEGWICYVYPDNYQECIFRVKYMKEYNSFIDTYLEEFLEKEVEKKIGNILELQKINYTECGTVLNDLSFLDSNDLYMYYQKNNMRPATWEMLGVQPIANLVWINNIITSSHQETIEKLFIILSQLKNSMIDIRRISFLIIEGNEKLEYQYDQKGFLAINAEEDIEKYNLKAVR